MFITIRTWIVQKEKIFGDVHGPTFIIQNIFVTYFTAN